MMDEPLAEPIGLDELAVMLKLEYRRTQDAESALYAVGMAIVALAREIGNRPAIMG
jgi:hypothetical protein